MSGKIVITGSNRGIGRSIAEKMASEKYGIIMVDYDNAVLDSAKSLNSRYGNVEGIKCDVSSYDACVEAFSTIDKKEIYGIVNNAGINRDALFKNMSFDQWDAVIKTDLYSMFNVTKQFVDSMIENLSGRIVNISSASWNGNVGQANYSSAKAGVIGFTKTLSRELGRYNITSNAIVPGFIKTPMTDQMPEKIKEKFIEKIPLKRMGSGDDVANAVSFLMKEDSNYVNGILLEVGGGMSL
ncbi:short-chain dehydrogenase/reductase SDR [Ferroplasma acidiphilum]|uniref:Short-chain dehydrogenase/reductase SDR n=2 Tax=Ferroplasma TaxID=74968 RepID=S0AR80_FERAC|nr:MULTISPECIES: 3-oxoacyl-ACP reductase FabG [Ferroplasma]AGO61703.1 short-chain dehydrogenase/reductase SDR [Ferroplasma acidarmanus Fer1]ARD84602.1 short-chain dehydrogenase/reductase SDR [Ferroplasma acidiphilum]